MAKVIPEPQQNLAAQVQQLLKMNESLVRTNESLKEMVISVVELLKDPGRNLTYPGDLGKSNATGWAKFTWLLWLLYREGTCGTKFSAYKEYANGRTARKS